MADFKIFTDTTCDFTPEQEDALGVQSVPTGLSIGGKSYLHYSDCRELSIKEFYSALRAGLMGATFSAPPDAWVQLVEPCVAEGHDALLFTLSAPLSSMYQNACIAASELEERYPDRRVAVIDSQSGSHGIGILVEMACRWRDEGKSLAYTVSHLESARTRVNSIFVVDSLKHLCKGGRVSMTAAIVGTMLSVKPIVHLNPIGQMVPFAKMRGKKNALRFLSDSMDELGIDLANQHICITHADAEADALLLRDMLCERFDLKNVTTGLIGPTLGCHCGPGTVALFFIGAERRGGIVKINPATAK